MIILKVFSSRHGTNVQHGFLVAMFFIACLVSAVLFLRYFMKKVDEKAESVKHTQPSFLRFEKVFVIGFLLFVLVWSMPWLFETNDDVFPVYAPYSPFNFDFWNLMNVSESEQALYGVVFGAALIAFSVLWSWKKFRIKK